MHIQHNDIKMMCSIGQSDNNAQTRWKKMNWYAVSRSHDIIHTHGRKGHVQRQRYRHKLWQIVQNKYPESRIYKIPYSIRGNSQCKIKIKYRIINKLKNSWISKIFGNKR